MTPVGRVVRVQRRPGSGAVQFVEQHPGAHALHGAEGEFQVALGVGGERQSLKQAAREAVVGEGPLGEDPGPHRTLGLQVADLLHRLQRPHVGIDAGVPLARFAKHVGAHGQAAGRRRQVAEGAGVLHRLLHLEQRLVPARRVGHPGQLGQAPCRFTRAPAVAGLPAQFQRLPEVRRRLFRLRLLAEQLPALHLQRPVPDPRRDFERLFHQPDVLRVVDLAQVEQPAAEQRDVVARRRFAVAVVDRPHQYRLPVVDLDPLAAHAQTPVREAQGGERLRPQVDRSVRKQRLLRLEQGTQGPAVVAQRQRLPGLGDADLGEQYRIDPLRRQPRSRLHDRPRVGGAALAAKQARERDPRVDLAGHVALVSESLERLTVEFPGPRRAPVLLHRRQVEPRAVVLRLQREKHLQQTGRLVPRGVASRRGPEAVVGVEVVAAVADLLPAAIHRILGGRVGSPDRRGGAGDERRDHRDRQRQPHPAHRSQASPPYSTRTRKLSESSRRPSGRCAVTCQKTLAPEGSSSRAPGGTVKREFSSRRPCASRSSFSLVTRTS